MANKQGLNKYIQFALIIALSLVFILFTQQVKIWRYPDAAPITGMTFVGLFFLWLFSLLGIMISDLTRKTNIGFLQDFPILGWVSIVSMIVCLISDFAVNAILAVDFLSITTPILAFAGVSVANQLTDLTKTSWKILIVAIFVFSGAYLLTTIVAQFGLWIAG
ncbi:hypothetical protein CL176_06945 [Suicoccus acidiformans]|uniref:Uncharacterized protein n=1 Tax=Suicoccus acidiformans TaxID=2036206 RepID=A0A347WNT0_9LACT|nr:hypothetical protein [Suicoccus acidiformans]AXY26737.1 hypothetical protein CL176_06945 [Suicoccus acidiformans]